MTTWKRVSWAGLVAAWIAAGVALASWIASFNDAQIRDQLRRIQFWSLEAQFLILVALSALALPPLLRSLELRRRDLAAPVLISLLALGLVLFVAPRTNRIYYDEQIYQSIGQNLADLRLAEMCNDGTVEYGRLQCWRGEYNKEPYGYPYLLSLLHRAIGADDGAAHAMNAAAAALTVWIVFLLAMSLTGNARAARLAALVAALIPDHLRWSHTAAAEPTAALAGALAVLAAVAFVRLRSTASLLWMMSSIVFAAQIRAEGLLVAGVAAVVVLLFAAGELATRRFWWSALFGLALASVHLAHLVVVRNEGWGTQGPRFSTSYVPANLQINGGFFLGDERFPVLFTILAVSGLVVCRPRRAAVAVLLYFLAFWGIFLFFYAGSYNYGADDRFSLLTSPAVAVLAGIGASALANAVARYSVPARRYAGALVASLILFQFTWYLPFVRATGEEAWAARADVAFARSVARDLPSNSYLLTHNPGMFHLWGVNAGQASLATNDPRYVADVLPTRYTGGVFFHWNFWCNVADPVQQSFCLGILHQYPHTVVREYRERDYRYAIYRLSFPVQPGDQK